MELIKGLIRDINKGKIPHGSWRDARNIVMSEKYKDITNEKGFNRIKQLLGKSVGVITTNNSVVIFVDNNNVGEIHVLSENNSCVCILRSDRLNFNINNPIEGEFTFNNKQELIIAWWDGLDDSANPPRILNTNCLPFEVNVNCEPIDPNKIELLQLFPNIGCAKFNLKSVNNTGGNLVTGVFSFAYAYILDDGTITNFTGISNWVQIVKDLDSIPFTNFDGNEGDTFTGKSITMEITNLNSNFDRLLIAVIKKIKGNISAVTLEPVNISNISSYEFTYDGIDLEVNEDIVSLLTPTTSFTRVKTGSVLENRLHLANTKQQGILDYQPYANNIKVKWVREDDINLAKVEGSYKDPLILFNKKSFGTDTVIAPVIIFKFLDGTFSRAFHIPNTESRDLPTYTGFKSNDLISDINSSFPENRFAEALLVSNTAKYHEFFNDALFSGETGYWENQNETYPDEDCSDIKDSTGSVIGTLRNEKVRHHKMPSIGNLKTFGQDFYTPSTGNSKERVFESLVTGWFTGGSSKRLDFQPSIINGAYFTVQTNIDELVITALQDFDAYVRFELQLTNVIVAATARLELFDSLLGTILLGEDVITNTILSNPNLGFVLNKRVSIKAGNTLTWKMIIDTDPVLTYPSVTFSGVYVEVQNLNDSDGSTKALGIKLEDVFIPDDIKAVVDCYYVGYVERRVDNFTKIGQTRLKPDEDVHIVHNFDVKVVEPAVTPNYVKVENYYTTNEGNLLFNNSGVTSTELRSIQDGYYIPPEVVVNFYGKSVDTRTYTNSFLAIKCNNALSNNGVLMTGAVYQYREDLYNLFENQKIVIIDNPIELSVNNTVALYDGDISIHVYGEFFNTLQVGNDVNLGSSNDLQIDIHESASTIGYRYANEVSTYSPLVTNIIVINASQDVDVELTPTQVGYNYNFDYNTLNSLLPIIPAKCYGDCDPLEPVNLFPFRISRSKKQPSESNIINWREFLINDSYEMRDRDKGEIWKIVAFNRSLIIYQKYAMFVARPKDLLKTDSITAALGEGDIFDRKPDEIAPDGKGYAGNQSQWATFVCKHGVPHIDAQQGKVFIFNGELREISNKAMYREFEALRDTTEKEDNPFNNSGWVASFDESYNRLLITKHEPNKKTTLSYSFDYNVWVCYHDYDPNFILYTRNRLLSLVNTDTNVDIYQHNIKDKYGIYYENNSNFPIYPSYIEPVFNQPDNLSKVFKSIYWQTIVNSLSTGEVFYDESFTQILVYNNNQCTGIIDLKIDKNLFTTDENIRDVEYNWKFNEFRDIVINRNAPIVLNDGTVNLANLNNNMIWWKKSKFISKFVAIRFIYDNVNQRMLHIQHVDVLATKSVR